MTDQDKGNLEKIGAAIGGLAGKAADTAFEIAKTLDSRFRTHFEQRPEAKEQSYDAVRPLYQFGHLAGSNPDYQGRSFEDVESDLQSHWKKADKAKEYGEWQSVRDYISTGYTAREHRGDGMMG